MATRDRTALFLRYREEARVLHARKSLSRDEGLPQPNAFQQTNLDLESGHGSGVQDSKGHRVRRGSMEPDWVFSYNELTDDLAELERLLEELASLYAKHLLPSFGENDTSHLEHEIRVRSHRLTNLLHEVEQKARHVAKHSSKERSEEDKIEITIRRNIQKRFALPLQELSMSFRKKQKTYLDKLKEQKEVYVDIKHSGFGTLIDVTDEQNQLSTEGGFSESQLITVENASALAEERTRELARVTENVNDLATLVKDIASLVVDQGTVLDRVDYNLEEVKLKTFGALHELHIANRNQRKRHALCCIIILSIACGIMFTILVLKWTS